MSLYSDGSLQTVEITGSGYQAAGAAVTKGPLHILARVDRQHGRDQMCQQTTQWCNGEVDLLAKMATRLPVLGYNPIRPEDIAVCGSLSNVVHGWFVASFRRQGAAIGLLGGFIW